MITFHSRQPDCDRRARKNENSDTVNFTSQIASSICTVTFTKRVKPDAAIFKSRCSRTVVCYRFDRVEAEPLVITRFLRLAISLPKSARRLARRARDGRGPSGKKSDQISRARSAHLPGNGRTEATAIPRTSVKTTRKTVCLALDLNLQCPRRKLARQPAICPRNSRAAAKATSRKRLLGFLSSACNHDLRKL